MTVTTPTRIPSSTPPGFREAWAEMRWRAAGDLTDTGHVTIPAQATPGTLTVTSLVLEVTHPGREFRALTAWGHDDQGNFAAAEYNDATGYPDALAPHAATLAGLIPGPEHRPPATLPNATRQRWHATGNKSQRVALQISQWTALRQPGTIIPATDVLISLFPHVNDCYGVPSPNNPDITGRAIRLLADRHIVHRDRHTGHYHVAVATPPPRHPRPNSTLTPDEAARYPRKER